MRVPVTPDAHRTGTVRAAAAAASIFRVTPRPRSDAAGPGEIVYEQILAAIQRGDLRGGQRLHDKQLAAQLGVSRTPVREALLGLRGIGVVDMVAARYTSVAVIDRDQTIDAANAWWAIYPILAAEVITAGVPATTIEAMEQAHQRFLAAGDPYDLPALVHADAEFYEQLPALSRNKSLIRCIENTVHVLQIGLLSLPCPIEPISVGQAQQRLIHAARCGDPNAVPAAFADLSGIRL